MILAKQIQCLCVYNVYIYICLYKSAQARVGLHSSVDSKEKHKVLGLPVLGAWLYFPAMLKNPLSDPRRAPTAAGRCM